MFDFPKIKTWSGQPVKWITQKCDGHLCCLTNGHAYSKTKDVDNWDKLKDFDFAQRLPPSTVLLGELHCPGIAATSVPTLVKDCDPRLQFTPFAVPMLCGDYDAKDWSLEYARDELKKFGYEMPALFQYEGQTELSLINTIKRSHWEGVVLKEFHMSGWYKLKPTRTVDAFVYHASKSTSATRYGALEALYVAVYENGRVCSIARVGSGFSDEMRYCTDVVGRVCEVEYDSLAGRGRLKFPRFLRWRDDKLKEDCLMEQLE